MRSLIALIALSLVGLAGPAAAVPVSVTSQDVPNCDPLLVPPDVHELGEPAFGFPLDEGITSFDTATPQAACIASGVVNALVVMTNLSPFDYDNVWYVADPETTILNFDGLVNGEEAFRIDMVGFNTPLIAEVGGFLPGIFESGETWEFIIDGYMNLLGLPASNFFSVGLVGGLSIGDPLSSGSIIATPVPAPEPHALLLVGLALGATAWRRRA